ncbi:MAG TPA: hypothetical protein VE913_23060 [Longimicrobium sp.]|nr:hypothetical protein [Longimicrobium sp.]
MYLAILLAATFLSDDPNNHIMRWGFLGAFAGVAIAWFARGTRDRRWLLLAATLGALVMVPMRPTLAKAAETFARALLVGPLFVGIPIVLALGGLSGVKRKRLGATGASLGELASRLAPPAEGLAGDEDRIRARLREIAVQRERIASVRGMLAREAGSEAMAPVLEKVEYAAGVLHEQELRHEARLWSISLVRWQHSLAEFVEHTGDPAFDRANLRLGQLAAVVARGSGLPRSWEGHDAAETAEGARCIAHLRSLLDRCETVRQGIVVQQAMLAIREIQPDDDETRSAALSVEPLAALQGELGRDGSLAKSLASFEAEHERLRDDQETARDVERFLRQLEREPGR